MTAVEPRLIHARGVHSASPIMLSNSLTRDMGLKAGPVLLYALVKHYFDRVKDRESLGSDRLARQDEVLYDEVFHLIKAGLFCLRLI